MSKLGFSIYPEHNTYAELVDYIDRMKELGAYRVFTCLLSIPAGDDDTILAAYRNIIAYARSRDLEVVIDVAPSVFDRFHIHYDDLSFFHDLGVSGIRLDMSFDGTVEARLSYNPFDLKIEMNASDKTRNLDQIFAYHPKKENLIACHNFYPQRYTGLGRTLFDETSAYVKSFGLKCAAFVGSLHPEAVGPWPLKEGLCTLEDHRTLPLDSQIRQLVAHPDIDDIIISNVFPTGEELASIKKITFDKLQFKVVPSSDLSPVEREILFAYAHFARGDMSDYMARSTMPRIDYKDAHIRPHDTRDLKRGDVVILNDDYGRYKGELHIVLKDMINSGNKNIVAQIVPEEWYNLKYVDSWKSFEFTD